MKKILFGAVIVVIIASMFYVFKYILPNDRQEKFISEVKNNNNPVDEILSESTFKKEVEASSSTQSPDSQKKIDDMEAEFLKSVQ